MSEIYGGPPPSEQPPAQQPPAPEPAGGQWPAQQPPSEQWPAQQPPAQQPPTGQWVSPPPPPPPVPEPHRRDDKPKTAWFIGVVLIVLGVVFLLEQFGWVFPGNWWAIFIYIGAAAVLVNMVREWRAAGWFDSKAAGSLTGALVLLTVGTLAYLDVWDPYWPLILVAIGLGIVIGWILGAATERTRN